VIVIKPRVVGICVIDFDFVGHIKYVISNVGIFVALNSLSMWDAVSLTTKVDIPKGFWLHFSKRFAFRDPLVVVHF